MSVNISQNLRVIRKKLGFSEEQVSAYLGVTRAVLRKYENTADNVPFEVFDKLSDLYGVDMSVFFEEDTDNFQQSLVCAFRTDGITSQDLHTIAKFKNIVNNYLQMCNLSNNGKTFVDSVGNRCQ